MSGYFITQRSMIDHEIVGVKNPTYHAAWNWMLHEACYQPCERFFDGKWITVRRGEFVASLSYMLKALPFFTLKQLRRFLQILTENGMITVTAGKGHTPNRIFVCNYNHYQRSVDGQGQAEGTQRAGKGQAKGNNKRKEEGNKEVPPTPNGGMDGAGFAFEEAKADQPSPASKPKRERENVAPQYTEDFNAVWAAFPLNPNSSKQAAFKAWNKVPATERPTILPAARIYAAEIEAAKRKSRDGTAAIMHLSTFLNQGTFRNKAEQAATAPQSPASAPKASDAPDRSEWTPMQWHHMLRLYAGKQWNTRELGPVPGFKGCQVPPEIVTELDLLEKFTEWGTSRNHHHKTHPMYWGERAAA